MKKPNYIEIRLPGRKSTFTLARRRYLSGLAGKVLEVNFARDRERKLFKYEVTQSDYVTWRLWPSGKDVGYWRLRLGLKVPSDDHNKVL